MMKLRTLALAAAASFVPAIASAQSGTVAITAQVQTPITVAEARALSFGSVVTGAAAKAVAYTDATSGAVEITATPGQAVNISVGATLVSLTCALCATGTPAITATINTAGYINSTLSTTGGAGYTLSTTAASSTTDATSGKLYILFGASVSAPTGQAAGAYSGSLTFNVAYPN